MNSPASFDVDVGEIRRHYDRLSRLYRIFWGEHLHHGYWENGESATQAQIALMRQLAERAGIQRGAEVLDIGCGLGGSAFWLAQQYDCRVTGLTISPVQARMATKRAQKKRLGGRVRFQVADANCWQPEPASTDVIWIMESSEHFREKADFFQRCAFALRPGGTLAVCAWLRGERPFQNGDAELVTAIGKAMLSASLDRLSDYAQWMRDAGLAVTCAQDITKNIARTWDHCSRMVGRFPIRHFVRFMDASTREFVQSFPLMQRGYATGAMAFGLFVAKKP